VQETSKLNAPVLTSVAQHGVRGKLGQGNSSLVIGGLNKRLPSHHWDGRIEAARIVAGVVGDDMLSANPEKWQPSLLTWIAKRGPDAELAWAGADGADPIDPQRQAMNDLCHVLLNANEFFYLH
jgi:hypothetical protein